MTIDNQYKETSAFTRINSFRGVEMIIPKLYRKSSILSETKEGGKYESSIAFCPPPFIMLTISIGQIVIFALRFGSIFLNISIIKTRKLKKF